MRKSVRAFTCVSLAALAAAHAPAAYAQDRTTDAESDENVIIVTGSSLRNVAPVGSNVQALDRGDLEATGAQTVQQVLRSIPAVVGNNTAAQGGFGSFDGAGTNAPTIHSLGASASNSTLILLNGHRLPVGGVNHVLADPNIVAPLALERVEVLADGASSVYGSDAVAGVINFITRRNVDGIEGSFQAGFGDAYDTLNAGVLFGKTWSTGSALVSYNYSDRSNLVASDRDYTAYDHRPLGGTNQISLNQCQTPVITTGGLDYFSPYSSGLTRANALDQAGKSADCDPRANIDLVPSETRHNVLVSIQQEVGDRLTLTGDAIYSNRVTSRNVQRGTATNLTITNANPFFRAPTGSTATSAVLNFDATGILGQGAHQDGTAETLYFHADADYELSDAWSFNVGTVYGRDTSRVENIGYLCDSCLRLAVTGTTSATVDGVPNTRTQVLTTANAFDPFGGRTSAATLASLVDSRQFTQTLQQITNVYGSINGELFELPGGTVQIAVGAEYIDYAISQDQVSPTNLGPHSSNSRFLHLDYSRDVKSAYAELFVPIIGPEMDIPGVYSFELNVSGRIDEYSDFGSTTNPKIAANWEVIDGLRVRGNWSQSFVAPALTSSGANAFGQTAESSFGLAGNGSFNVPYSLYPTAAQVPGCVASATSCLFNASGGIAGVQVNGGFAGLGPQTGESWSVGFDFAPNFAPGLRLSLTYWNTSLRGGVTAPSTGLVLSSADLASRLQIYPTGATPAQIASLVGTLPQTAPLPTTPVYFTFDFRQGNVVNLDVTGVDFDASYQFDTEAAGTFTLGGSFSTKTRFDGFNGSGGTPFDALGTAGVFTTFQAIKWSGRANLGWELGGLNANLFVNYTGPYTNRGLFGSDLSRNPVQRDALGTPIGGGDPVSSFTTVDLNVSYTFEELAGMGDVTAFVDVSNLFDQDPPFVNANFGGVSGYDGFNASPIGRVVSLGLRAKF